MFHLKTLPAATITEHGDRQMSLFRALAEWYWLQEVQYLEINLSQCHFVHQQSHKIWPGTEPHPLWLLTTQTINRTNRKCCCETKINL